MRRLVLLVAVTATMPLTACAAREGIHTGAPASSSTSGDLGSTSPPAGSAASPSPEFPAAGSGPGTAPEPSATAFEPPPVAAPEPSPAVPVAGPCADVTAEYLTTTLRMTGSPRFSPAKLQDAQCSGEWATARTVFDPDAQTGMYLFRYSEEDGHLHWRVVDVGSALDCVDRLGVPVDVARAIGCGY